VAECVCGHWDCDGYSVACWDREVERQRRAGLAKQNERDRLQQAVIDAARALHEADAWTKPVDRALWERLRDTVRALDERTGQ
jgi:hypothetical protein